MFSVTKEALETQPQFEDWLESTAARIARYGLSVPAIAFLELHKPLAGVLAASTLILQPSLALVFGFANAKRVVQLFENRESVEKLIQAIEKKAAKGAVAERSEARND